MSLHVLEGLHCWNSSQSFPLDTHLYFNRRSHPVSIFLVTSASLLVPHCLISRVGFYNTETLLVRLIILSSLFPCYLFWFETSTFVAPAAGSSPKMGLQWTQVLFLLKKKEMFYFFNAETMKKIKSAPESYHSEMSAVYTLAFRFPIFVLNAWV